MKPLSKLHIEAVTKAKTEQDKIKAAANAMIETPMELIKQILLKHEQAVIEVMRELSQEIDQLKNRNWVGLTDDETDILITLHAPPIHPDFNDDDDFIELVSAIEAKLKEKNT